MAGSGMDHDLERVLTALYDEDRARDAPEMPGELPGIIERYGA